MYNSANLNQYNFGFLTGPQTNAAVILQSATPFWGYNSANVNQTNVGIGSGPQTNAAVIMQGH